MGKNMLILGSSGGLGKQVTEHFKKVYNVTALNSKDLDITNFQEVESYFIENEYDIVLNFAGYNYDCFLHKYDSSIIGEANKILDVNVRGTINLLSSCLPAMRRNQYGRIVLISSVLTQSPVLGTSVYSASKNFIDGIVRAVTFENLNKGITCNSIQLGYFDGGMTYQIPQEIRNSMISKIPLKRLGRVDELCEAIEFLVGVEYAAGINLSLNGGVHI